MTTWRSIKNGAAKPITLKKIHYPNLNSLRFIAAFVVIIHHTEQIKFIKGFPSVWNNPIIELLGKLGVDLFFVLSGFLITSLLFTEKQEVEDLSVKNFIIRRILRIWPLYFLIMVIAFFIMPHFPDLMLGAPYVSESKYFVWDIGLYLFFLPHVQVAFLGPVLYCSQAWSIGIEEQFYLIWPFFVKYFNVKKLVRFIFSYIICYSILCVAFIYLAGHYNGKDPFADAIQKTQIFLGEILKFDCLLIGCLFAVLNNKLKPGSIFISKGFQVFCYVVVLALILSGRNFKGFSWEIHAIFYGFIIMNLVRTDTSIINIDFPVFDYLGKISYGIYMYHILLANIILTFFYKYHIGYLSYPAIFIAIIAVSALSYNYFERYFLNKKKAYSAIATG